MFTQVFMVLDKAPYCSVTCVRNQTLNLGMAEQLALSVPLDAAGSPEPCLMFQLSLMVPAWRTSSATASMRHSFVRWAGSIPKAGPCP